MNLEDLRKICEQATPGPWHNCLFESEARFIATFNPAVVEKLLDLVEAVKAADAEPDEPGTIVSPGLHRVREALSALQNESPADSRAFQA